MRSEKEAASSQQPAASTCSDLISRQDVNYLMRKYGFKAPDMTIKEFVEDCIPSAEPERTKGKWLHKPNEYDDDTYECSRCGEPWTLIEGTPKENNMNYCPNCGADMRGE